jgi:hypothetical protein
MFVPIKGSIYKLKNTIVQALHMISVDHNKIIDIEADYIYVNVSQIES